MISCCQRSQLRDGCLSSRQHSGEDLAAHRCNLVSMRAGNLLKQTVGPQEAEFPAHPGTSPPFFPRGSSFAGEEPSSQVPVAQAVEGELASADGLQQLLIAALAPTQAPDRPASPPDASLQAATQFLDRRAVIDAGQGVHVALMGFLRNLCPPVKIR